MHGGSADEAVVVVKPHTEEGAVMYPRVKYGASGKDAGGEGRNMSTEDRTHGDVSCEDQAQSIADEQLSRIERTGRREGSGYKERKKEAK